MLESVEELDTKKFISKIMGVRHFSVLEHVSSTFGVEGISRVASHQLVRHRLASYSQKSQRYVTEKDPFTYIIPPKILENEESCKEYEQFMEESQKLYSKFVGTGIPAEDARFVLPNAAETKLVMTMNARELMHFFEVRTCNRAQWEIKDTAKKMYKLVYIQASLIFQYAGPACVSKGKCPEGEMS